MKTTPEIKVYSVRCLKQWPIMQQQYPPPRSRLAAAKNIIDLVTASAEINETF